LSNGGGYLACFFANRTLNIVLIATMPAKKITSAELSPLETGLSTLNYLSRRSLTRRRINNQLLGAFSAFSFQISAFSSPGIVKEMALSSAASVFACSAVSSTSGGRTVRHAGSFA
jgi:uncharacterized membrane protein